MRKGSIEFAYQVVSLIVSIIVVHTFYILVVRPKAESILAEQIVMMQSDPGFVPTRSPWIIIRDFEQEACFILMFWAFAIMAFKAVSVLRERKLLQQDLVPVTEGTRILPEDAREYARQIQSLPDSERHFLLSRSLLTALHRFTATRSIQDVSSTAHGVADSESAGLLSK